MDNAHLEPIRVDDDDFRILTVGALRRALEGVSDDDHIVIATDGWYVNIGDVALPDAYVAGQEGFSAVSLFPSHTYDARQHVLTDSDVEFGNLYYEPKGA